jgi:4-hydroxy-4-methyl-2-oxoglutarate aldolase
MDRHPAQGRIVSTIERADADTVEAFEEFYTGIVLDALGKYGGMHVDIAPLSPGMKMCGTAVTSLGPDLTVRRMAIDLAQPGDVLVVAAGDVRDYACFGDGTATRMMTKSLRGAVIDGCTRDAAGLRALGFPTFCRGITARNYHYPAYGEHGAVNVPVVCGGVVVEPGDLILGDDDGVVVVPRRVAPEIQATIATRLADERALRRSWTEYPPFDVANELKARGYEFE